MITVLVVGGGGDDVELKTPAAASAIATPPSTRTVAHAAMIGHFDDEAPRAGGGVSCAVAPVCCAGIVCGAAAKTVTGAALPAATLRSCPPYVCPCAAASAARPRSP